MKEAMSQEKMSDSSHSCIPEGNGFNNSSSNLKSAAMLGIALSVGTSGVLVSQAEASAAISAPMPSASTEAFSSDSKVSTSDAGVDSATLQVVAYHTVESGESLWQIAQQHRVGLRELKSANALPPATSIRVGQVLKVPASSEETVPETSELIASITADEAADAVVPTSASTSTATSSPVSDNPAFVHQQNSERAAQSSGTQSSLMAQADQAISSSEDLSDSAAGSAKVIAPQTAASVELADASISAGITSDSGPVVTALASPSGFDQYQVRAGDTLSTIAASLGTTADAIIRANALTNPNVILTGDTLRVPSVASANNGRTVLNSPSSNTASNDSLVATVPQRSTTDQLTHLRSSATRPESARILATMREAAPAEAASVGGEQVGAKDLLGSSSARAESIDPYVANLLEEVQEIRSRSVAVSEIDISETSATESDLADNTIENISSVPARSPLLARTENSTQVSTPRPRLADRVSMTTPSTAQDVDSELLAAAPLSPDAYIPAQRSSEPQVVSPDMPLLPSSDEYLPEAPNYFDGYIWPARGTVTSGYGWRWGRMHRGVDVAGPVGTPIVAAAPGVVESAGWNSGGFGNLVEIRHPDGSMTRYAHNNRLNVSAGQSVRQGQQIAEMGSTGYSTGPHLHFEVHKGGGAVNPVAFLPNR
ncbi:MAG: putative metalloendopeptidase [Phormidesmis priestleyi Ana]|uniref:Putative metalloendopeptidase n=1 Tax=Phormidesmis priestleyi Ana TaxID=1666911 RepID=A0A0P7ZXU2_9CYAN|nr:MAG: putative metalloendopeptidase [Phormidesmis priestleyi Ana]